MQLVSKQSGQPEEVPDEDAQTAFTSGTHALIAGSRVPVQLQDGSIGTVDAADVDDTLGQGGQIIPQALYDKHAAEAKYGNLPGMATTAGLGAARGLTLGLSDVAATKGAQLIGGQKAADTTRRYIRQHEVANPITNVASEIGGSVIPALASGGTAEAAEAPSLARTAASLLEHTPAGILGKVSEAAAHGVDSILGARGAGSALARVGTQAAKVAAQSAIEQAGFGTGQQLSEDTLGNTGVTAEKLAAAFGQNLLQGAEFGAIGGAGAGALREAAGVAVRKAAPWLDRSANEHAWSWLDPTANMGKKAMRAGGLDAVGKTVSEEVLSPLVERGGLGAAVMSPEEKLAAVQSALNRVGQQVQDHVGQFEGATVKLDEMFAPITERIEKLSGDVGAEDKVHALVQLRNSLGDKLASDIRVGEDGAVVVPVGAAIKQRRALQELAYGENKALDPKQRVKMLREISGTWNDLEQRAMNDAGEGAGDAFRALNKKYQQLSIARDAAEASAGKAANHTGMTLSDVVSGEAHAPWMLLTGHPIGAAGAVGASYVHKAIRQHGDAFASVALKKLSQLDMTARAVKNVDGALDAASQRFGSKQKATVIASKKSPAQQMKAAQAIVSAPPVTPESLEESHPGLGRAAPKVTNALIRTLNAKQVYLKSVAPQPLNPQPSLINPTEAKRYDEQDLHTFNEQVQAVHDPVSTLVSAVDTGRISREAVQAVKATSPLIYAEFQQKIMSTLAQPETNKATLPYDRVVLLSTLFDVDGDPSLSGPSVLAYQQDFSASQNPGPNPSQSSSPSGSATKRPIKGFAASSELDGQHAENASA